MDQYNKEKKAWEEAQPLMKEAADLNIGNNILIHIDIIIPPHYFTDDTRYACSPRFFRAIDSLVLQSI